MSHVPAASLPLIYAVPHRLTLPTSNLRLEARMFARVNAERARTCLLPLGPCGPLHAAASAHARGTLQGADFSHTSRGIAPVLFRHESGALADHWRAHEALIASAPHRMNTLCTAYRRIGFAVIDGGARGTIVADVAGRHAVGRARREIHPR